MTALDRKLLRDLRRIWAQTLAIALVLACGIMMLVGMQMTQSSLRGTQAAYYERHRFADVFAAMTRAPRAVVAQAQQIDGVAQAEGRIGFQAVLDVDGLAEPATGRVVSLPAGGNALNVPLLRRGRLPDPDHPAEVALNEPFAEANNLLPGTRFRAVLNGRLRDLTVTGWVLSPEFVYTIAPGAMMPDDRRYGLIWMTESAAEAAMDMGGAVNEIALGLTRGADARAVIAALDRLLAPYGGTGAYGRDRQMSHAFLDGEMTQLSVLARFLPPVFLLVAAFLVNMVLGRLIKMERTQIGLLKAIGYSTRQIAWHYLKLALLIGVIGVAMGIAMGQWIGSSMIGMYRDYFRFPVILRDPATGVMVLAAVLGMATALAGGWRAVMASVRLPPAEAMSPPAPPNFSRGWVDRAVAALRVRQTTMMILRSVLRWPGRAAITLFGVMASVALLVASYFSFDSVTLLADTMFTQSNRQQVTLVLNRAQPERAILDAGSLPGVRLAEGGFAMPARLVNGHRSRLSGLQAHFPGATLARLIDDAGQVVTLPDQGVVLPERLAAALDLRVGDRLRIEMLAPPRETLDLPVAAVIAQGMGQEAHIAAAPLFAAMRVAPQVNRIDLMVDSNAMAALNARIKVTPAVAGLTDWADVRRQFDATLSQNLLTTMTIQTLVGLMIAIGVVYNAARIQVSERSHELASLRVLGFSRAEVGYVLVGEVMALTLVAIPAGWVLGYALSAGLVSAMATDLMAIPFVITRRTYAMAGIAVFVAALGAVLLVRRRLDRVDLAVALKARE
ncbi:MAG TPA: ABC transporter permease [Pararhodobacter sp.]|uniref:ABC transporter permease n=1 Tax=Pararhodobacter sp. TaxID=2127056 RepID=UPI002B560200|nr:ABC transporter permease [Pararhodobacter sp.]HPD90978.1 ABC transporter permease [Pararhodobacter sp.]